MKKVRELEGPPSGSKVVQAYKELPLVFKIFFWIFIIGFITSLNAPFRALEYGYGFLGKLIPGVLGFFMAAILTVGGEALRLVSFVKRKAWMWKFLVVFQGYLILNQGLAFLTLDENLSMLGAPGEFAGWGSVVIVLFLAIEVTFLFFVWKNKGIYTGVTKDQPALESKQSLKSRPQKTLPKKDQRAQSP